MFIIIKPKLAPEQGSWTLGPGPQPGFQTNLTISHQANPRFGGKPSILVAIVAKTICVCDLPLQLQGQTCSNLRFFSLLLSSYATNLARTTHSRSLNQCGCPKITACPTGADWPSSLWIDGGSFARLTLERMDWPRHATALLPILMHS